MPGTLYMKVRTGENYYNIDQYPNFHCTGSIIGIKKHFYGKDACLIRCGQWIYKVPKRIYNQYKGY